jgi:RNA polymerase sigma-70 factor, ECF subfamily
VRIGQYRLMSGTVAPGSNSKSSDAALISRSLADPEAFSLIVERHATALFRYLASRVDRASSEDLLADVFEAAFRARHRYDGHYDDALPWLLGIAANVIRHHRRSQTRYTSMLRRLTLLHGSTQEPSEVRDAVVVVELRDRMQCVRRGFASLNDKHRDVLVLSAGLGLSYEDISRALGVSVGTVRSRIFRARTRLRELLDADGQYRAYAEPDERPAVAEENPR